LRTLRGLSVYRTATTGSCYARGYAAFYRRCDRCGINKIASYIYIFFFHECSAIAITKSLTAPGYSNAAAAAAAGRAASGRQCARSRFIGVAHPAVNARYYALEITLPEPSSASDRIRFRGTIGPRAIDIRGPVKL